MATFDIWSTIHAERAMLATDLETISAEQWSTPSLCAGWTVRDTLAHMTASAKMTAGQLVLGMLQSGFSFQRLQARAMAAERGRSGSDTLARFRAQVNATNHPPGPTTSWLGEVVLHSEDIRRPLGIRRAFPIAALVQTANFYKGSNLMLGSKRRIAGLRLRATDTDWRQGDGPEVAGPMQSLLLVMTGRKAALADVTGDGVAILRSRS